MSLWKWSQAAATNATADASCPFPEGMAPSAMNDGTRGMMAAVAKYRDDIAGAIVTTGTSTAFAVSTYQGFDTLAHMHGAMICFTPHTTNGANGTSLNVDGLGAKPILSAPGAGLQGGVMIQGTPYAVTYNNTDGAFYLHGYFGNPYNVPLASGLDYWGPTAPNSAFAFPVGQAISRTTYAALFALVGTTFGGGDGSTTFNLPDKRGRVSAALDAGAGRLTDAVSGFGDGLGEAGGTQSKTLVTANLPAYTPTGLVSQVTGTVTYQGFANGGAEVSGTLSQGANNGGAGTQAVTLSSQTFAGTAQGGTSEAFGIAQPTIACNYIIRII
jgi:microcystin-dependent protein